MKSYLWTELMKTQSTTMRKIIVIIPLICMIMAGGFCALGGADIIKMADITTLNHWGLIWLPASIALMTGLFNKLEAKSTGYKTIYGLPISTAKVWIAKNIILALLLLIASIIAISISCTYRYVYYNKLFCK